MHGLPDNELEIQRSRIDLSLMWVSKDDVFSSFNLIYCKI